MSGAREFEILADMVGAPLRFGLTGLEDIDQCVRLIVATLAYGVPLDCAFAGKGAYIDSPLPHETALRIAELTEAIEKYEPRVRVLSISFAARPDDAHDGRLYPRIRLRVKEGVL